MSENYYSDFSPEMNLSAYDYVIIGSGIGSLTAGQVLSKAGKRVVILEKHSVPGGFTHVFNRGGFKFDVGLHYIGNVGETGSVKHFYNYISDNKLQWTSIGPTYDVVYLGNKRYEFKAGKENFRKQMYAYFPTEKRAIDQYLEKIRKASSRGNLFFIEKVFKRLAHYTIGKLIIKRFNTFSDHITFDVISSLTSNKELIGVLCAQLGNYGLSPKQSSFVVHAVIVNHYMEGGYYPIGGVERISKCICESIKKNKGEVYCKANVSEIVTEKNKVQGLIVNNQFYSCSNVISNVGAKNTFNNLLKADVCQKLRHQLAQVNAAVGHIGLYIGLNKSAKELGLPSYNVWLYKDDNYIEEFENLDLKKATERYSFMSCPSAKDPEWDKKFKGKATVQLISMCFYDWVKHFDGKKTDNYYAIKQDLKQALLSNFFELFPQAKDHVEFVEVSTPITTKRFTNYQQGEIYGIEHTPQRFRLPFLRIETPVKGLRLVGQDVTLVGVTGSMLSGLLCATNILKMKSWRIYKEMLGGKE